MCWCARRSAAVWLAFAGKGAEAAGDYEGDVFMQPGIVAEDLHAPFMLARINQRGQHDVFRTDITVGMRPQHAFGLREYLSALVPWWQYALGGVYVLTILYLPMGLMGIPARIRQRLTSQAKDESSKKLVSQPS
jgi:hypothetical protein